MNRIQVRSYINIAVLLAAVLLGSCRGVEVEQMPTETAIPVEDPGAADPIPGETFLKVQELGAYQTWDLALGDLNGDGYPDLFTASLGQQDPRIWINDGAGFFSPGDEIFPPCARVEFGDVDGDNSLDILIAEWDPNRPLWASMISVWLNDGEGHFSQQANLNVVDGTQSMILGDLNGDKSLDLFVVGTGENQVWINNGQGVFSKTEQTLPVGLDAAVGIGDLDGDGDLDLLSGGWEGAPSLWMNDGTGSFSRSALGITDPDLHIHGLDLGDLDQDGDLDAFVVLANRDPHQIWINDGRGEFSVSQTLAAGLGHAVMLGDIDGDGDLDGVSGHGYQLGGYLRLWWNEGEAIFTDSSLSLGNGFTSSVVLGDLDLDGDLDIISAQNAWGEENGLPDLVWLNKN
jgi:hypothetical protein